MNLKKNGKVFTSKFVGTGPLSYEKRIYWAAVSQRLRNTDLEDFCSLCVNYVFLWRISIPAGIVDDRFMNVKELERYSKMPDLQTAQAGVVAVLNSAAVRLTQNLTHHQQTLLGHLRKHVELQQESSPEEDK